MTRVILIRKCYVHDTNSEGITQFSLIIPVSRLDSVFAPALDSAALYSVAIVSLYKLRLLHIGPFD